MTRRPILHLAMLLAAACTPAPVSPPASAPPVAAAPPVPPPASAPPVAAAAPVSLPVPEATGPLHAVFHLSDPGRAPNARGLTNAHNALKALGEEPARIVLVVHGQAVGWLRRAEPDNLGAPIAALLATGKVELRVCGKTLDENHWVLGDLVPGATVVPSGTLEVLRLQRAGYVYFRP